MSRFTVIIETRKKDAGVPGSVLPSRSAPVD